MELQTHAAFQMKISGINPAEFGFILAIGSQRGCCPSTQLVLSSSLGVCCLAMPHCSHQAADCFGVAILTLEKR